MGELIMYHIKLIEDQQLKSEIAEKVMRKLPHWFGNEEALVDYVNTVKEKPFYATYVEGEVVGFICLKLNNPFTADIYVMGILEDYHRHGIGREMVHKAEQYLRECNYRFLMVKTLGESADYEYYNRTRHFYRSVGFYPLEEFTEIWDEENPCLIMVKNI